MPYANNKCADQPAHPRNLISAFFVRCLVNIIPLGSISKISSLCLASVASQAGLSLPWSETEKTGFLVTRLKYESNCYNRFHLTHYLDTQLHSSLLSPLLCPRRNLNLQSPELDWCMTLTLTMFPVHMSLNMPTNTSKLTTLRPLKQK